MIKAEQVKEMVKDYNKKVEEERLAKIKNFLDEKCEPEIIAAASNGRTQCSVGIPTSMEEDIPTINALLFVDGYYSQTRHGYSSSILIRWDK